MFVAISGGLFIANMSSSLRICPLHCEYVRSLHRILEDMEDQCWLWLGMEDGAWGLGSCYYPIGFMYAEAGPGARTRDAIELGVGGWS